MPHGLIASNEHGVVVSADLKNYVFTGYTAAPAPSGGLYVFDVVANPASIYGVRLPVDGQGAVVSAVNIGSGMRVTVLGSGVLGLLVFSPIAGGGSSDYGMALFNAGGECTFDSVQDHLVVGAAGNTYPNGGELAATGDTAIYVGAGIYPTSTSSSSTVELSRFQTTSYPYSTYNGQYFVTDYSRWRTEVWVSNGVVTTTNWTVSRPVVRRGSGFSAVLQTHQVGQYNVVTNILHYYYRYETGVLVGNALQQAAAKAGQEGTIAQNKAVVEAAQRSGALSSVQQYPYTQSAYNTTQNTVLVTDSSLYLQ